MDNTSNKTAIPEVDYDSVGTLEATVQATTLPNEKSIDDALGLQPISIRLQKDLIDSLKGLAQLNGLGYQPLIRQILTRWVDAELKHLLNQKIAAERPTATREDSTTAATPTQRRAA